MNRMLIAAHARFADGLESALSLIMGKRDNITCINAFVTETPLEVQLSQYAASIKEDDCVIVVTDAFFGSVNQKIMEKNLKSSLIVTGASLPLALELASCLDGEELITAQKLEQIVELARKQLMVVEPPKATDTADDFDF